VHQLVLDLLRTETDPSKSQTIVMVLAEEEANLSTLSSGKNTDGQ